VFSIVRTWVRRLAALVVIAAGSALFGLSPAHATVGVNDYPYASSTPDTVDSWNFYTRECTSFVAWRINNDLGIPFTNQYGNPAGGRWGNAEHWDDAAASIGLAVDGNPAAHSVAVWNPYVGGTGSAGHVAFVMSVNGDGTITVEEYNWASFAYDQRTISPSGLSFIHF
jgi:surface antigen